MLYPVRAKETRSMQTRDGIRLDADLYYPNSAEEFPVLLMRQPYGRSIASTVVYAHPAWYAAHGYIVVIQDVRGRGSSEGEFDLFAAEIADGLDTVNWAASLPQSNGQVGMYGFSYQGMTQLYAAAAHPSALKTICPSMAAYDLYADWAYEGGAFCYQLNLGWAIQLAAETTRRQGDQEKYLTLYAASRNPPFYDPVCPRSGILHQLAPDSHYHDWLTYANSDAPYWAMRSPKTYLANADLPMLHIGGWFDTHLRGTVKLYQAMVEKNNSPQHLIIGPWAHLPWSRKVGSLDYGEAANSPIDRLQLRWFDHFLKGIDTGLLDEPPVCLFEMGSNHWRKFDRFPNQPLQSYRLLTTGLSAMREEGKLVASGSPPDNLIPDTFVHDPWRPVPALGGHATFPAGSFDRSHIDSRSDVLTYTSDRLDSDLHLAGEIFVELYCTADAPSFDLCAVLSEVKPNGQAFNLTQGYLRIPPAQEPPYSIALQPICALIPQGSAIRLSISAACFPAYAVNPGGGTDPDNSQLIDASVITVTLWSEGDRSSKLHLPGL
jgi:putative CocE/NonD family hydrolase